MNGKWILMVVAGLAFGAAQPAHAAPSSELETVCELNFLELQDSDLAKVPEDKQNSFFTPVNEGDSAIRKCTESNPNQQAQQLECRRVFTDWSPIIQFQTKTFKSACQMVSCDGTGFVDAANNQLKVRALGPPNTVEVILTCNLNNQ